MDNIKLINFFASISVY